jgi:hypothetical protein
VVTSQGLGEIVRNHLTTGRMPSGLSSSWGLT